MLKLADLPNQHGFTFTGIKKDGTEIDCYIYNSIESGHIVLACYTNERVYNQLVSWKR